MRRANALRPEKVSLNCGGDDDLEEEDHMRRREGIFFRRCIVHITDGATMIERV